MEQFGILKRLGLREAWKNEASDFTPWLADNLGALGEALGMDLVLERQEADVGDFSLDLLAKDLISGGLVIIENQLERTDHTHLGQLLTYASGFNASVIVWVAESIRDEHRQTLEWLNQRTDSETQFFGVVIEVIQIDDSKLAPDFKLVVFPNEWQKEKRRQAAGEVSIKAEAYQNFFQSLIDDLRENHKFTNARRAPTANGYSFVSGFEDIYFSARFGRSSPCVDVYIDKGDIERNRGVFDTLKEQQAIFEKELDTKLEWDHKDDRRRLRIITHRNRGSIESSEEELKEIHAWMVKNLLAFKQVFSPRIKAILG